VVLIDHKESRASGDVETGKIILRDFINAAVGFSAALSLHVRPYQRPAGVQEYEKDQGWTAVQVAAETGRHPLKEAFSPSFLSSQSMLK